MEQLAKKSKNKVALNITRTINAPRALVFQAFTDPEHMTQWWGPRGFTNSGCEIDARPGGKWKICMDSPEFPNHWASGEFKEIKKPERIVFISRAFENENGVPKLETLNTISLKEEDSKTILTLEVEVLRSAPDIQFAIDGMQEGWGQSIDKLTEYSNTDHRVLTITRLLNAPVELVWEVWTKPEHIKHWWGPTGFTNTIHKMDMKEDGVWDFIMHGPDGTDYKNKSVFSEVIPLQRISYHHISGPKFYAAATFQPQGNQTLLTWQMIFESIEQREQVVKVFKADVGLKQNVDKLEKQLADLIHHTPHQGLVVVERTYEAPVSKVWKALTDKEEMKQWYFNLAEFKAEVGFEFEFSAGESPEKEFLHQCKIVQVEFERKLAYTWRYPKYSGTSVVTFELIPEGQATKLKLTHQGIDSFPTDDPSFAKESFSTGWNYIINTSLKEYLEK